MNFMNLLMHLRTVWSEGAMGLAGTNTLNKGASSSRKQACMNKPGTELGRSIAWASHKRPQPHHSTSFTSAPAAMPRFQQFPLLRG